MQILLYIVSALFFFKDKIQPSPAKAKNGQANGGNWALYLVGGIGLYLAYRAYQKQQKQAELDKIGSGTIGTNSSGQPIMIGSPAQYAATIRAALEGFGTEEEILYETAEAMFKSRIAYEDVAASYRLQYNGNFVDNLTNFLSGDLSTDLRRELDAKEFEKFFAVLKGIVPASTPKPLPTVPRPNVPVPPVVVLPRPTTTPTNNAKVLVAYATANVNLRATTNPFRVIKVVAKGQKIGQYLGQTRYVADGKTQAGYVIGRIENGTASKYVVSALFITLKNA